MYNKKEYLKKTAKGVKKRINKVFGCLKKRIYVLKMDADNYTIKVEYCIRFLLQISRFLLKITKKMV